MKILRKQLFETTFSLHLSLEDSDQVSQPYGLQSMLDCCFDVSRDLQLTFNCTKSCCFAVGKGSRLKISNMNLGLNSIQWCDSFKYLGVTFHAGLKLKTNIEAIKQKFFYGIKQCAW